MRRLLLFSFIVFSNSALVASADEISGVVSFSSSIRNCPVAGLTVEVDPKKGSPQPTVLTATAQDGSFNAKVIRGHYLLVLYQKGIKVYQSKIEVEGTVHKLIALHPADKSFPAQCEATVPQAVGSIFLYANGGACTIRTQAVRIEEHSFARLFELTHDRDLYLFVGKIARSSKEKDEFIYFKIPTEARPKLTDHGSYASGNSADSFLSSKEVRWSDFGGFEDRIEGDSMQLDKENDYRLNFVSIDRSSEKSLPSVVVNVCEVWHRLQAD